MMKKDEPKIKYCEDCRFHQRYWSDVRAEMDSEVLGRGVRVIAPGMTAATSNCFNPKVPENLVHRPIQGEPNQLNCFNVRGDESKCGTEGKWFLPKSKDWHELKEKQ